MTQKINPGFKRTRLIDLAKHEKQTFAALRKEALNPIPRVEGNPRNISGWTCIGMEPHWLGSKLGFDNFKNDIGKRLSLPTKYHVWVLRNASLPYVKQNIGIDLTPKAKKHVIEVIRKELKAANDLGVILTRLQERNVPSESQRVFINVIQLEDFIKRHKAQIMPKPSRTI